MSSIKLRILKEKLSRIVEAEDESKKDFLMIMACHKGLIMPASVNISFRRFKEKYGEQIFEEVKNYLLEEEIIFIPNSSYKPICFSLKNEKDAFDYQQGEELSNFFGKLIFEHNPHVKEVLEELLKEPEGKEFLKHIAMERGIHIIDGVEPKVKKIIGKHSYEKILNKLLELGILNKYAWSSRKHGYSGYYLLPYIDKYIMSRLEIFELSDIEKITLTYIGCLDKIFSYPTERWIIKFIHPDEYDKETLAKCKLLLKFLSYLTYQPEDEIKMILEKLKCMKLIEEVDLGYTGGGYHRGIILALTESGRRIALQGEGMLIKLVENKVKDVFSNRGARFTYYLFTQERVPLKVLSLIEPWNVNIIKNTGIIGDSDYLFLQFKNNSPLYKYIYSKIEPEEIKKWLKENVKQVLSEKEEQILGFFSSCKKVVIEKSPDWKSWRMASSRTQRNYEEAYKNLIVNFPYLKKMFSQLTSTPIEEVDKIISTLEEKGFLVRERDEHCGYPGYALIYRVPIKFDFEFDMSRIRSKVKGYMQFLAENIDRNYKQLIFLDYLVRLHEKYEFKYLLKVPLIKEHLLQPLQYNPPKEYSPIYSFEDDVIIIFPPVITELKKELYKLKTILIESIKRVILELVKDYRNNVLYNYVEKSVKEGCYILNIESPDPSVGLVSFIIFPWITPLDRENIISLCVKSNTVNIFTIYPNYPRLRSLIKLNQQFNLILVRNESFYLFLNKLDALSKAVFERLNNKFNILLQESGNKLKKDAIEELEAKYPNLRKIRFIIPEVEELIRNAIRPRLIREFGDVWQDKIKQYFPKAERKKQRWEKNHPNEKVDILQGLSIGELNALLENKEFSFLKDCFKQFQLAKACLQVFLSKKVSHA